MIEEFKWQNGAEVDDLLLALPQERLNAGFWLGDGLFETLLVEGGEFFAKERHLQRLLQSGERIGLRPDLKVIESGLNGAVSWLQDRCGQVRVTYLSSGDVIVTAREYRISDQALKLILFPYPKADSSILSGVKSISYGESGAALRYARSQGCDDVITVNSKGIVVETALANILFWDGKEWLTPTLDSGCLPGVTRELLIESFGIQESVISVQEIQGMKALATTSSLRDIQGVSTFQDTSGAEFSFEQEPVDRLRELFRKWRRENPRP